MAYTANPGIVLTDGHLTGVDLSSLSDTTQFSLRTYFKAQALPVVGGGDFPVFMEFFNNATYGDLPSNAYFQSIGMSTDFRTVYNKAAFFDGVKPPTDTLPTDAQIEEEADNTNNTYCQLDVENWTGLGYGSSNADKDAWDTAGSYIVDTFRARILATKPAGVASHLGLYKQMPYRRPTNTLEVQNYFDNPNHSNVITWKTRNDRLDAIASTVDVNFPSLYMLNEVWSDLHNYVYANCAEAKRVSGGKEVIAILWPQYHTSYTARRYEHIDGVNWRNLLEECLACPDCDGIELWGLYYQHLPSGAADTLNAYDQGAGIGWKYSDWWAETLDFMASSVPTGGGTARDDEHILWSNDPAPDISVKLYQRDYFRVAFGSSYYFDSTTGILDDPDIKQDDWNELFVSVNTATQTQQLRINKIDKLGTIGANVASTPVSWSTADNVTIGGKPGTQDENFYGALQETWIGSHYVDWTTYEDIFTISGAPADLGVDYSGTTGAQPEVYINGDVSDGTAQINLGTLGGIFTVEGTLAETTLPSYTEGTDPPTASGAPVELGFSLSTEQTIQDALIVGDTSLVYTRASLDVGFDETGVLDAKVADEPTFAHDTSGIAQGIDIYAAATNLFTSSKDVTGTGWDSISLTARTAGTHASLDGGTNGGTIKGDAAADALRHDATVTPGDYVCYSAYVKNIDSAESRVELRDGTSTVIGRITITWSGAAPSVSASHGEGGSWALRDDWYMIWVSGNLTVNTTCRTLTYPNRIGVSSLGIALDELQLEYGRRPTSRIRTTTTSVTRAQPALSTADAAWMADGAAGTIIATFVPDFSTEDTRTLFELSDAGADPKISIELDSDGTVNAIYGATGLIAPADTIVAQTWHRAGITWDTNSFKLFLDGAKIGEDLSLTLDTGIDQLVLGNKDGSGNPLVGQLDKFLYWDEVKSESFMVSWDGTDRYFASCQLHAKLQKASSTTLSLDGVLAKTGMGTTSLDSLLYRQGLTKTTSFDAAIFGTGTLTCGFDASLLPTGSTVTTTTTSLDAVLTGGVGMGLVTTSMDAILRPGWAQIEDAMSTVWTALKTFEGT